MLKDTRARNLAGFLQHEFSRVSKKVAEDICAAAELKPTASVSRIGHADLVKLMEGIAKTKILKIR